LTKEDIALLRRLYFNYVYGGFDAREEYQCLVALAELIERLDPNGEKLLKEKR
jgi:hypothetical protein